MHHADVEWMYQVGDNCILHHTDLMFVCHFYLHASLSITALLHNTATFLFSVTNIKLFNIQHHYHTHTLFKPLTGIKWFFMKTNICLGLTLLFLEV